MKSKDGERLNHSGAGIPSFAGYANEHTMTREQYHKERGTKIPEKR